MVPRRLRLTRRTFPSQGQGLRASSPHLSLVLGPASNGGVAVVISKKVARRSVDRHRLKRRLMSLLVPFASQDRYLVVYARSGSASLSFHALSAEVADLVRQISR